MNFLEFKSSQIEDEAGVARAVEKILAASEPLVLVNGLGGTDKQLLKAGEKSAAQDLMPASALAEGVRTFHIQLAQQLTTKKVWKETQTLLSHLFEELSNLLQGIYLIGELSPQGTRMLESYAERAGATIIAQVLREKGREAQPVCGRHLYLTDIEGIPGEYREQVRAQFREELASLRESQTIAVIPSTLRSLPLPS